MSTPPEWAYEIPELYDAARRTMHDLGFPWTDPRTNVTYPPPPCTCDALMEIHRAAHVEIDEADPIAHTAFRVLGCPRCRMAVAFPASNLDLVTPRARRALHLELAKAGWWLPFPERCREYRPDHNGECLNCDEPADEHEIEP